MGLFRKGKTRIIAKFLRTDLFICNDSREGETPSYSRINMVSGVDYGLIMHKIQYEPVISLYDLPFLPRRPELFVFLDVVTGVLFSFSMSLNFLSKASVV